jgi:Flp pilus assembly protein TadB
VVRSQSCGGFPKVFANCFQKELARLLEAVPSPDFIFAAGDDRTDEDLFERLQANAWTIDIGLGPTRASFFVAESHGLRRVLESFAELGLIQSGYRDAMDVNYFGAHLLGVGLGFATAVALLKLFNGFDDPFLPIGVAGLGFFLPRFILKRMIRDRQQRIRLALPDALDLTVICVEAGLALDQALMRVGQDLHHSHPDLSDEFHLVDLEMRAGKPRAEALRNLVDRTGVDDIRSLIGTLIQCHGSNLVPHTAIWNSTALTRATVRKPE